MQAQDLEKLQLRYKEDKDHGNRLKVTLKHRKRTQNFTKITAYKHRFLQRLLHR